MGRKIEKALRQSHTSSSNHDGDDGDKTPEPHNCNGHFQNDFTELCRRQNMVVIPPVALRPKRPPSPSAVPVNESKDNKKGDKNKAPPPPEPEPEIELDENGDPVDPPPKTYIVKEKFEYFKPSVQVEMDNPDKQETVNEVFIRGWKVDIPMMDTLNQCFVTMDKLHTINFWSAGITAEVLVTLSNTLPHVTNLKSFTLEANPIKEQNFHLLITEESPLQQLSLRGNAINDTGAELIGKELGTVHRTNTKLISLNLTNNNIGDKGAEALANGLRLNRTLLSLTLANNCIGNNGAEKLGEVLSRFALTHEEIVERRKLISEKGLQKSPPSSRQGRAASGRSGTHTATEKGKTQRQKSTKKDAKETKGKDEKETKGKGGKEDKTLTKKGLLTVHENFPGSRRASSTGGRGSGASMTADGKGKGKDKKGKDKTKTAVPEVEVPAEITEAVNPLLEPVESINDEVVLPGNRMLINLNLTKNDIGEEGLKAILLAVQYQITLTSVMKYSGTGLMRVCLNKNRVPMENDTYNKLTQVMMTRDPNYKPPKSPDEESQA